MVSIANNFIYFNVCSINLMLKIRIKRRFWKNWSMKTLNLNNLFISWIKIWIKRVCWTLFYKCYCFFCLFSGVFRFLLNSYNIQRISNSILFCFVITQIIFRFLTKSNQLSSLNITIRAYLNVFEIENYINYQTRKSVNQFAKRRFFT